jgi:hypothetical protein
MEEPSPYDLDHIRSFMETKAMGPRGLIGEDGSIWGFADDPAQRAPDLISLQRPGREDAFSKWVIYTAMKLYFRTSCHRRRKPSEIHQAVVYNEDSLLRITHFITAIIASILQIVSVIVLWFITSYTARLTIIAVFNLVLSMCLTAFTKASRAEVFAITSA